MKLRKGDKVRMRAGRDLGKTGEVTRTLPRTEQVLVEGLNIVKRHTKPSSKQPKGGILELTKPIAVGKVALICPSCKQPTRVGYQINKDHKERICRKCKAVIK
jgi:large subunit ribosomal protein L24